MLQAPDLLFQTFLAFFVCRAAVVLPAILEASPVPSALIEHLVEVFDPFCSEQLRVDPVLPEDLAQVFPCLLLLVGQLLEGFCEDNVIFRCFLHVHVRPQLPQLRLAQLVLHLVSTFPVLARWIHFTTNVFPLKVST